MLRQNGRILLRLDDLEKRLNEIESGGTDEPEGLPVGREAPAFELPDLLGERKSLAQFRGQPLLLIFFNPACGFCRDLAPKLAARFGVRRQAERDAALDSQAGTLAPIQSAVTAGALQNESDPSADRVPLLLIISTGDAEKNRQFFSEHQVGCPVLLQKESEVATAYQARGTPMGYLVSAEGKIASAVAVGAEALLALANGAPAPPPPKGEDARAARFSNRSVAHSKIKRDGLKAGNRAPEFSLPRIDGAGDLALEALRGRRVLLVFSDTRCGPCSALASDLEKFHREHAEVEVLMISRGEPKENRAKVKEHGLTFPVVLQRQWEISRLYAMFATPMAYLIDEQGVITNDVAVGVEPILGLMRSAGELKGA